MAQDLHVCFMNRLPILTIDNLDDANNIPPTFYGDAGNRAGFKTRCFTDSIVPPGIFRYVGDKQGFTG